MPLRLKKGDALTIDQGGGFVEQANGNPAKGRKAGRMMTMPEAAVSFGENLRGGQ